MMFLRYLLSTAVYLFITTGVNAQDTLVKTNNTHVIAKIIEINPKTIKYKNFENQDGPLIILERRHVARIHYANGDIDTINVRFHPLAEKPPRPVKPDLRITDYGKNHVSLVVSDLFFQMASLGYERILPGGRYSVKIPLSVGFRFNSVPDSVNGYTNDNWDQNWEESGYYYKYKIFSTGIEFYYYTGGQGTFRYFIGPAFEYGMFNYLLFEHHSPYYYSGTFRKETGSYFAIMAKNGLNFQVTKQINISGNMGAGFYRSQTGYSDYDGGALYLDQKIAVEIGIMAGYRF